MDSTSAALLGAVIGGLLSVLASWLAQRLQTTSQWQSQEIARRQQLYSDFVEATARCYADALEHDQPNTTALARFYGTMGRMRLISSEPVLREANRVAHRILDAYAEENRTTAQIREFLAHGSVDLLSDFGDACREELIRLQPLRTGQEGPLGFKLEPVPDPTPSR